MSAEDLSDLRIVVTRAQHQSASLAGMLRKRGAKVDEIPTIEIRPLRDFSPLDSALGNLAGYDWLVVTSANGVEALFDRAAQANLDLSRLKAMQICAIGPATRNAVQRRGLPVSVVPERYVAESVVEVLRDRVKGKRVLLARATEARDVIPRELGAHGASVDVVSVYETTVPEGSRERLLAALNSGRRPDVITFTSSSTARHLIAMLGGAETAGRQLDRIALASVGPVTSTTLRQAGLAPAIEAREFTMTGLVEAISRWHRSRR